MEEYGKMYGCLEVNKNEKKRHMFCVAGPAEPVQYRTLQTMKRSFLFTSFDQPRGDLGASYLSPYFFDHVRAVFQNQMTTMR